MAGLENPQEAKEYIETVLGTWGSAMGANAKSSQMRFLQEERAHQRLVKALIDSGQATKDDADQKARKLKQDEDDARKADIRNKALADGFLKAVDGVKNFASGSISASQGAYNATDAFQAAVPTLGLLSSAAKTVADVLSSTFSGTGILGGIVSGAAKAASGYIEISTQLAKAQLENASKYVRTYSDLSKVGVTFGGDLTALAETTKDAGISMDSYATFVKNSKDDLVKLGGGIELASIGIARMGKELRNSNTNLAVMYGTVEDFDSALASYSSMMASYGVDVVKNNGAIKEGANSYLQTLKDLTDLTGRSVESQMKDEDKRSQISAYQDQMASLAAQDAADGGKRVEAQRAATEIFTAALGEGSKDLQTELVAQKGALITQSSNLIQGFAPVTVGIMRTVNEMARSGQFTSKQIEAFAQEQFNLHKEQIAQEEQALGSVTQFNSAVKDENLKTLETFKTGLQGATSIRDNLAEGLKRKGEQAAEAPKQAAKDFVSAVNELQNFKIKMDTETAKNLGDLGQSAKNLIEFQSKMQDIFGGRSGFLRAMDYLIPALEKIAGIDHGESWKRKAIDYGATAIGATIGAVGGLGVATVPGAVAGGMIGHTIGSSINDYFNIGEEDNRYSAGGQNIDELIKFAGGRTGDKTHYNGLNDATRQAFEAMVADYAKQGGGPISINSGARTAEEQAAMVAEWKAAGGDKDHPTVNTTTFGRLTTPADPANDPHVKGIALDLDKSDYAKLNAKGLLAKYGFAMVPGDEGHIQKMAKGGVTDGTSIAGEAGPEAVVPLPDGRTIPVKMDMADLIDKFDEMIDVLKDHRDTSEKIYRATV